MSAVMHTHGEWKRGPELTVVAEDGSVIARLASTRGKFELEAANAELIAAAPELLAALRGALAVIDDYLDYDHDGDPWKEDARTMGEMDINDYRRDGRLESARAAIAKATGAQA